ncbi:MAG: tetratricopeptide repeat protein, partial [Anaerolineae bacterium]
MLPAVAALVVAAGSLLTGPQVAGDSPFLAVAVSWLWFLLPGLLLGGILLRRLSWLQRIPVAFVLSMGLSTPYTIVAILLHLRLDQFMALSLGTFGLILAAFVIYRLRRRTTAEEGLGPEVFEALDVRDLVYLILPLLIGAALAFLSSQWLPSGDDLAGLPYFAEVLRLGQITGTEPFHGTGTPVMPRNELIVWGYQNILLCRIAGTTPAEFFMNSRPLLVLLAFLALYTFLHQAFKKRRQALFLLGLWSIYLFSTMTADGAGSDLVTRIIQDKFQGWFLVVPIVIVFAIWFLESRRARYLLGLGVGAFGATLLHPIALVQVLILSAGLGLLYLLLDGPWRGQFWRRFGSVLALGLVLGICLIVPVIQYFRFVGRVPIQVAGLGDAVEFGRISMATGRYRLWLLDGGRYILHPSIILEPMVLAGYVALPFLIPLLRRSNAARLIVSSMVILPVLVYVPALAGLVGQFVTPYLLWRLAWPITTFALLSLGWLLWLVIQGLAGLLGKLLGAWPATAVRYLVPPAIVLAALFLRQPEVRLGLTDFGERQAAAEFNICTEAGDALAELDRLTHDEPADVLASRSLNYCIPGSAALANVVEFRGFGTVNRLPEDMISSSLQRTADAEYWSNTHMVDDQVLATLERWSIDYVLMEKDRLYLDLQLRQMPDIFGPVYDDPGFTIYAVTRPSSASPIVEGNSALRQRNWTEAEQSFRQAIREGTALPLAHLGLGMALEGGGDIDSALASYEEATRQAAEEPALHARLAETYLLLRDADAAAAEYERAVELAPGVPALYTALALTQRLAGREDDALANLERAAALQTVEGTAAYYSSLASNLNAAGWTAEAAERYRQALAIEPDPTRYVALAQVLASSGDLAGAVEADQAAIRLNPWSEVPHIHLGSVYQSQGDTSAAIEEYESAWRLNPANHSSIVSLGAALQSRDGVQPAIEHLEALAGLNRVLPGPYRALSSLYLTNGQTEDARQALEFA